MDKTICLNSMGFFEMNSFLLTFYIKRFFTVLSLYPHFTTPIDSLYTFANYLNYSLPFRRTYYIQCTPFNIGTSSLLSLSENN